MTSSRLRCRERRERREDDENYEGDALRGGLTLGAYTKEKTYRRFSIAFPRRRKVSRKSFQIGRTSMRFQYVANCLYVQLYLFFGYRIEFTVSIVQLLLVVTIARTDHRGNMRIE